MTQPIPPISTQLSTLAAAQPNAPALTCVDRTLTRAQLDATTNRLARAYANEGVGVGDYVSIALPNSIEMVQALIACWKLGATPQPLSARLPDVEFQAILDVRPRALIVGRADPRGEIPNLPADFMPDDSHSSAPLEEAVSPVWKSMTSGGSTGRPKLIEAGTDSRLSPLMGYGLGAQEGDVHLVSLPLTHNTAVNNLTAGLLLGHHLVVMPRFDAAEFLKLITEYRVNFLATVPTVMQRVLPVYRANPESYDLSSLRRFWHMGGPCPPVIKQAWIDLLGPGVVWELYAGTELQALTMISGEQWLSHPGSVGVVVIGEMKVLDDDRNECPPGTIGEIYMRPSPGSAPTYHYVGATAKTCAGWDSLGDLGYFDADGFLYLSDRRVDMFTVGGRNVYPAEVEAALSEHPDIVSCLVVGVPDSDLGQVPYALVQSSEDSHLDKETVRTFLAERVAAYKVPKTIEFVDRPLRDEAGKARRTAVRDELIARGAAPASR
jgi:bile acid-coenzyme A ligase